MSTETIKTQANEMVARGKDLVAEGKQRQVLFINRDNKTLLTTNLTVVVGVAIFSLLTGFITFPIVVIAAIAAVIFGIRVELHQAPTA